MVFITKISYMVLIYTLGLSLNIVIWRKFTQDIQENNRVQWTCPRPSEKKIGLVQWKGKRGVEIQCKKLDKLE